MINENRFNGYDPKQPNILALVDYVDSGVSRAASVAFLLKAGSGENGAKLPASVTHSSLNILIFEPRDIEKVVRNFMTLNKMRKRKTCKF